MNALNQKSAAYFLYGVPIVFGLNVYVFVIFAGTMAIESPLVRCTTTTSIHFEALPVDDRFVF
jgi:hypothetical protein